jgi:SRSO17 transposase
VAILVLLVWFLYALCVVEVSPEKCLNRLANFLDEFSGCFGRRKQRDVAHRYIDGLLTDSKRKSMRGMLGRVRDPVTYQTMQHFITHSVWKAERMWERVRDWIPDRKGVVIVDDTGFAKQGNDSVGVARQYSGTLGRVGNCQIAVSTVLRSENSTWPLGMDLYLPEKWANDEGKRAGAIIPERVVFQPKWKIALAQISKAKKAGFEITCVCADAAYGNNAEFRDSVARMGLFYAVGANSTTTLFVDPPKLVAPKRKKTGRPASRYRLAEGSPLPQSAAHIAANLPASAFRKVSWRKGTKGTLQGYFAALTVTPARGFDAWDRSVKRRKTCWLLIEKNPKSDGDPKFYLSNLPAATSLKKLITFARTRWAIEQNYQQLKDELGLDHFEGRRWDGWQHHTVLTVVAFIFLESERRRLESGYLPPLPAFRHLISEVLVFQIISERGQLADFWDKKIKARGDPER